MPIRSLTDAEGNPLGAKTIEPFLAAFRGAVIRPGDAEYEAARRIWNAAIDSVRG
jgi:hypothetical protein